ncbi:MAG: Arc family DNA-binding protein [Bifidobacteriaceae bacterium]|jgi:plasmid stability protein|nr:Arc family DNA-binding protein [Bifidobacteriaceae bacterium]
MAAVTVRGIPEETHRALKARAAKNERSTEAEIRAILQDAVFPPGRESFGAAMARIWRDSGLTDEEVDEIQAIREQTRELPEPALFE